MIILVDMDGVLVDWSARFDEVKAYYDHAQIVPPMVKQLVFDLYADRTEAQTKVIKKVMQYEHFYKNIEPLPGAIEAIKALDEKYTVFIVSSPDHTNPNCASDKLEWVRSWLGEEWCSKLILTQDKTAVIGDVLIDDKPEVKGRLEPSWKHIVFDATWNQGVRGWRIFNWHGVYETTIQYALEY